MPKRELIPASEEHQREFPLQFRLKPQYRNVPECQMAFEHAAKYKLWPDEIAYLGLVCERVELRADGIDFVEDASPLAQPWLINMPEGGLKVEGPEYKLAPPEVLASPGFAYLNFDPGEHFPPIRCPVCNGQELIPVHVRWAQEPIDRVDDKIRMLSEFLGCPLCQGVGIVPPKSYGAWVVGQHLRLYRMHWVRKGQREAAEEWGLKPSDLLNMENGTTPCDKHPFLAETLIRWIELDSLQSRLSQLRSSGNGPTAAAEDVPD